MQASISLDEAVSPVLLQLLQCALCGAKGLQQQQQQQQASAGGASAGAAASPVKHKKEKEKTTEGRYCLLVCFVNEIYLKNILNLTCQYFML